MDTIRVSCYRCNEVIEHMEYSCTCVERGNTGFQLDGNQLDSNWDCSDSDHDDHDNYEFYCPACGRQLSMRSLREHNRMTGDIAFDGVPPLQTLENMLKDNKTQVQ